jgi:hypothetical protein
MGWRCFLNAAAIVCGLGYALWCVGPGMDGAPASQGMRLSGLAALVLVRALAGAGRVSAPGHVPG